MENIIYKHISKDKKFEFNYSKTSRYGFKAIFFTNNQILTDLYLKENKGECIEIISPKIDLILDFNNKISYSPEFRNLIHELSRSRVRNALIKNVIDFPSKENKTFLPSDILVFFDLRFLKSYL